MKIIEPNSENTSFKSIILWWEFRRIPYNIFVFGTGFISFILMFFVVDDYASFITPPFGLMLMVIAIFIGANICYTLGPINQIIIDRILNQKGSGLVRNSFKIGLIITTAVTSMPVIISAGHWIITGERYKSVYAGATKNKPNIADLIGEYKLDSTTIKGLDGDILQLSRVSLILGPDGQFETIEIPEHDFPNPFKVYSQENGNGKWTLELSQGRWVICMNFEKSYDIKTNKKKGPRTVMNSFEIHGEHKPYTIYRIVGDPDSWDGLTFKKKY